MAKDEAYNNELETLTNEIREAEAAIKGKKDRLHELLTQRSEVVKKRVNDARKMKHAFKPEELIFSATARCDCGAGLAYPEGVGVNGSWDCADILTGKALPKSDPKSKMHAAPLPFMFYEIRSENQPSANGATTRPKA